MKRNMVSVLLSAVLLSSLGSIPAFAASYQIKNVTVGFTESKEEAGEIRDAIPTCRTSYCEITDWSCSHDQSEWSPGNKVTFTVEIEPTDDHHFSKSETQVKLSGKNAEIATQKVTPSKTTLKINYWPSLKFAAPENLIWEDEDEVGMVAAWDKVEHCSAYEVKIQVTDDDDKTKNKTVTVTKPKIDLSDYATDGDVTFSVRAIPKNDTQKKYYTASEWVSMNDTISPSSDNTVTGNFSGSEEKTTFTTSDGTKATGWQLLNGKWYYFDADAGNTMVKANWKKLAEDWFYFDVDGSMVSGWAKVGDFWYCFNSTEGTSDYGKMLKGWVTTGPNGPWYYLNPGNAEGFPEGACLTNTVTPDGYPVDETGAWRP